MPNDTHARHLVDARGLNCPMPLLKAKLALNACAQGDTITVMATDSGSVRDFHAFAELSNHRLMHFAEQTDDAGKLYYEYTMQKG